MRSVVKREELQKALAKVMLAVPAKHTLPILTSVLLTAEKGQLQLVGNDLETAVIATCPAKISCSGGIAVPPKALEGLLKQVDTDTVNLSVKTVEKRWKAKEYQYNSETNATGEVEVEKSSKTTSLTIEAGKASLTIAGNLPVDFPPVPHLVGKPVVTLALDKAICEVSYAVAKEENRPILCGISLNPDGNKVKLAAADGFRLAISTVPAEGQLSEKLIMPARTAKLVQRLLPGTVSMFVWKTKNDGAIGFQQKGDLTIIGQQLQGTYPQYEQLVPKKGKPCSFSRDELREAINTVMAVKPRDNLVRLQSKGQSVIVSADNNEGATSQVKVTSTGKIKAGFDGKYLKDLLSVAPEKVTIRMENGDSPAVMRNNDSTHVLMPRAVKW